MVEPESVVETASEAAHEYVFSRLATSSVDDIDVTVTFEDDVLDVQVSIIAPAVETDLDEVAEEAAQVAGEAVDDLLETD